MLAAYEVDDRRLQVGIGTLGIGDPVPRVEQAHERVVGDVLGNVNVTGEERREANHVGVAAVVEVPHPRPRRASSGGRVATGAAQSPSAVEANSAITPHDDAPSNVS